MKTKEQLVSLGLEGFKADEIMLLQSKMVETAVKFQYKKRDGSVRDAVGTLNRDLMVLEDGSLWQPAPKKEGAKPRAVNPNTFGYFDLDRKMWRSFVMSDLIAVEG